MKLFIASIFLLFVLTSYQPVNIIKIDKGESKKAFSLLTEEEHKTWISFHMIFSTPEECEKVKVIAVDANEQDFDRLETELAKMKKL